MLARVIIKYRPLSATLDLQWGSTPRSRGSACGAAAAEQRKISPLETCFARTPKPPSTTVH